jgi:septation ring formation regulator
LDYLSIEYNINEAEKKIADVFDRLNVLNLEDSSLELKTISTYFDGIYNDFDKEKIARRSFNELGNQIADKVKKMSKIASNLVAKLPQIKSDYAIGDDDLRGLNIIEVTIKGIKEDFDAIVENARRRTFAYSKLNKEMQHLNNRITKVEDNLDSILRLVSGYREDEQRAHDQLDEIKSLLASSKEKISSYKLPLVPKRYYVELSEATEAINEMVRELEKKPLNIEVLNTRVDTARDLTLKLYKTTNEIVKTASMSEHAIVYGNRYRSTNPRVNEGLKKAEMLFFQGNFKASLEDAINAINIVEPGIHERLLKESKTDYKG